jgi:hypothetical protein
MNIRRLTACAALFVLTGVARAGNPTVMHCFAWTPIKEATAADWERFYKASDALPLMIEGIMRIWYGKLVSPLSQAKLGNIDREAFRQYQNGDSVTVPISRMQREYGMCIEFRNTDVLKAYDEHPYHKVWTEAYAKIRVDGTTTFDIMGR